MPSLSRLRRLGPAARGLVPAPLRARLLASMGRRAGPAEPDVGMVSVVVVPEEGDRVESCLASVRGQTHPQLEVVVAPVGAVVVQLPTDPQLRTVPPEATSYDAVRAGVAAAMGRYVVLVRGCDQLLPGALGELTGSLAASGSDLATGVLEQSGEPEPWLVRAQRDAHAVQQSARPAPAALAGDLTLANKAFTRDLASRLALEPGDDWLCAPTLARLMPELTVDVIDRPVARYAWERGHRAFGARPSPLPHLDRWLRLSADMPTDVPAWADGWRRHWYDVLLPRFVADAERADDTTWERLVTLSALTDGLDLRASSRSLLALAAAGRRSDVEALSAELDGLGEDAPTELTEDGPAAVWSSVDLPVELRRLAAHETALRVHAVREGEPEDEGRRIDLWTWIEGVDHAVEPPDVTVSADGTGLEVARQPDPLAERWAGARYQSAAAGAVQVVAPARTTHLVVESAVGRLRRTAKVRLPPPAALPTALGPVVESVGLEGDRLVVRLDREVDGLWLQGPGVDVPGDSQPDGSVAFATRRDLYGRPVWLSTAVYRLHRPGGLAGSAEWRARLPVEVVGAHHRLRVLPDGEGPGELHLGPPRTDDELGAYGQQRLRTAYAVADRPTDPGLWYFESFAGRSATDTPLAVYEELRRRRPEAAAAWGILDHGHWAPAGSQAVVIGSRAWYDVLGTARVLVTNTELEAWYRRRPDQLVVQCFHGYPSKAMGMSQWGARELPPRRVAVMRRRSVETWDLISTPTPEMTEVYREQYGYTGAAMEHGYPRDDALRGPDAAAVRDRVRRQLGVRPDQTAVLYAPTWRDHLATRPRAAAMSEHLDVDAAAAALGDSHVVLLRGHRFHAPGPSRPGVVEVTDHPEVNDLVLASDVAVLDYSSLRFDYAITGRPMVFLVPDLADYTAGVRGFLFPFEETAPGPLVSTTDEVVAEVRDVAGLAAAWSERLAAFDARFNPYQDGHAAARLLDAILDQLGRGS